LKLEILCTLEPAGEKRLDPLPFFSLTWRLEAGIFEVE
jgi:hypothetical protein